MTRLIAATALAAAALLPAGSASACDPNTFPNCQTYCAAIASRYDWLQDMTYPSPPDWPRTGVAGCP